ncbi:transposase [Microvirga vignae]|uniref:transposase n=1 Tax=Microvirga vignae TaxID=1225564 RepID=UPI000AD8BEC6
MTTLPKPNPLDDHAPTGTRLTAATGTRHPALQEVLIRQVQATMPASPWGNPSVDADLRAGPIRHSTNIQPRNSHRGSTNARGATSVIQPKADRVRLIACDFAIYNWRHLVENFFCDPMQFRRIATRYDKTDPSLLAMIYLAASLTALK